MIKKYSFIVGRFQPYHLGHDYLVNIATKHSRNLIICIGSSQYEDKKLNPFSSNERIYMINSVMKSKKGINYKIILMPDFHNNEKWINTLVKKLPKNTIIFCNNNLTEYLFKSKNYEVIRSKMFKNKEKGAVSGKKIRLMIAKNDVTWRLLVPKPVYEAIIKFNGIARIKNLYK